MRRHIEVDFGKATCRCYQNAIFCLVRFLDYLISNHHVEMQEKVKNWLILCQRSSVQSEKFFSLFVEFLYVINLLTLIERQILSFSCDLKDKKIKKLLNLFFKIEKNIFFQ